MTSFQNIDRLDSINKSYTWQGLNIQVQSNLHSQVQAYEMLSAQS